MPTLQSTASTDTAPPAPAEFSAGAYVAVLLPFPVNTPYDYVVPEDCVLALGDVVEVPIGRRFEIGVVWGAGRGDVPESKLKSVVHRLDVPSLPDVLMRFIDWVASYTLQPAGAILRMTINPIRRGHILKPATVIIASGRSLKDCKLKPTPAREKVLGVVGTKSFPTASALTKTANVSAGVIRNLIDAGVLNVIEIAAPSPFHTLHLNHAKTVLEDSQNRAATVLLERLDRAFTVTLLDGVTGSGKTEVYLEAVAEILRRGKQALVLVPEIALTAQGIARFSGRFGGAPAVWHSDLNYKLRRETWLGTASGSAKVIIGARSALFLPFQDLGLIVVDEEHDARV